MPVINILTSVPSSTHGAHIRLLLKFKDQPADPCSACDICRVVDQACPNLLRRKTFAIVIGLEAVGVS